MDQREFEAQLKADGYEEIELQELAPRAGKGRQTLFRYPWLGPLVQILRDANSGPVAYGPGQIFAVDVGELHDESIGADGARVVVGRKFTNPNPSGAGAR
jgi:hypothetical protein